MIEQLKPIFLEDVIKEYPDLSQLSEEKLKRFTELKIHIEELHKNFEILYYEPQWYQEPFHKSQKKIRSAMGGNQSGKSTLLTVEILRACLGIDPYNKYPKPPLRCRLGTTDLQKGIGEDIQFHLDRWVPLSEVDKIKKYPQGQTAKIIFANKSSLDFLSYEQESKIWEGWQGDLVALNECPPKEKYDACLRGLMRRKGKMILAMTPLTEPWLWDDIWLKRGSPEIDAWNFDTYDNKYLDKAEIKIFEDSLDPEDRQTRIKGIPRHLFGLIYKEFSEIHCINSFEIPRDWTYYFAVDYHPRTNVACLWVALSPQGIAYVIDELWTGGTIQEISEKIKAIDGNRKIRVRWIDPLSATPERTGKVITSAQREFARCGIPMRSATKEFSAGLNAVKQRLRVINGVPGIYFFKDRVPYMLNAMTHYQWDEYKEDDKGTKDEPKKQYGHFPDILRYILIARPVYRDMKTEEDISQIIPGMYRHLPEALKE